MAWRGDCRIGKETSDIAALGARTTPHMHSLDSTPMSAVPTTLRQIESIPGTARITRLSMLYGANNSLYERAIDTHMKHTARWGHRFQVLREDLTSSFWNKPVYILYSLIQELARPSDHRAEWLM